jgi:hypothetical protein
MVQNMDVVLKRFEHPDEVRTFEKGKFEIVRIGGMTIGRATYEPGWRWSLHVGPATGTSSCSVEHVGIVVSGARRPRWTPAPSPRWVREMSSISHRGMTAGWLATSPTSPFIFSARTATLTVTRRSQVGTPASRAVRSHR